LTDRERADRGEKSINDRDLFGSEWFGREANPFLAYLAALTTGRDDITIIDLGPTSTEYRVCRSTATELAGGDEQIADWLLKGEVLIHRMPRGLKNVEERVEWIRQNKISIHKVTEQIPEEFPGDLERPPAEKFQL
jgi:hypothetical protein